MSVRWPLRAAGEGQIAAFLPGYYGYFTAIWCLLPALAVLLLWVTLEPKVILMLLVKSLPESMQALPQGELNLLINNIQNLASGDAISGDATPVLEVAAERYLSLMAKSQQILTVLTLGLAGLGGQSRGAELIRSFGHAIA